MRPIRWSGPAFVAGQAQERARRAVAVAAGVGTVLWVLTHRSTIVQQAHLVSSWWTPLVVTLLVGTGATVVAAALAGRSTGVTAGLLALAVPSGIAALVPAGRYGCFGPTGTWIPPLVATAVVAAVLAWPRGWPLHLVASGAVAVAVDFYVSGGQSIHSVLESLTRTWVMQGFFACVAAGIVRAAAQLDAATAAAVRQAAVAATAEATDRERSRFAGLIHDNVLATLLDAARGMDPAALPGAADRTLRQLDDGAHHTDGEQVAARAALESWQAAATEVSPGITVASWVAADAGDLPRDVVTAIGAATGEAARNSLRHATIGREAVARTVSATVDAHGATVRIDDDGAGFDPRRVSADRLGIRHSIVDRMRRVPGGDAVVASHPGRGTTVILRWLRAEPCEGQPPTLLSLRGGTGIALLVVVELAITMLMVGYLTGGAVPVAALAGYGLVGVAGAAVLIPRHDPLPWSSTALIVAAGPVAVLASRLGSPDHPVHHPSWILMAYSYVLALLGIRGRVGAAWIGLLTAAAGFAASGAGVAAAVDGSAVTAGTVLAVTGFAWYMRPTLHSFHRARAEAAGSAGAAARTAAHDRERHRQLAYLDRTARPMLELIATGRPLTDLDREECALLEAQLRDRLRAPGFATPGMELAAQRARQRGVTVTLLDDGGLDAASGKVRDRVTATAIAALDDTATGRITVRALPPGRALLATIVVTADPPRRLEIGPDGTVLPTPEHTALA
ncbi:sensor histidine kinase [Nocardia blacklockiae]|uniref:sensor histidine kinase n=1 Tax=Nocardia blacklockiae TaxID=480036 RepID=UPI0018963C92|nr:ATP-binding protein [Nocardia blacklockiae]MBF6173872.1 ATP-binding protein [Nocardia blacklockiae]